MKIEKGVPLPPETRGRPAKYHFEEMEVGDSVFATTRLLAISASGWGKSHQRQFVTRKVKGGWRTWRIT